MNRLQESLALLDEAEVVVDADTCTAALKRVAAEITRDLAEAHPMVLPVMGGAVVFTGQLLPLLAFPLDFDYIHVSRYGHHLEGREFHWRRAPQENVKDRHVLILDDILDEGVTLAAVKKEILALGAASCRCAVFADKDLGREKPIRADYVGVTVPNRFVFGYGMDAAGHWRNLPAIYAKK